MPLCASPNEVANTACIWSAKRSDCMCSRYPSARHTEQGADSATKVAVASQCRNGANQSRSARLAHKNGYLRNDLHAAAPIVTPSSSHKAACKPQGRPRRHIARAAHTARKQVTKVSSAAVPAVLPVRTFKGFDPTKSLRSHLGGDGPTPGSVRAVLLGDTQPQAVR